MRKKITKERAIEILNDEGINYGSDNGVSLNGKLKKVGVIVE